MDARVDSASLLEVQGCRQAYHKDSSADLVVLNDVNVSIRSGEMVALLGRSGSGKSTLLRIVAGLLSPTAGRVIWRGKTLTGPADGVAMVFQSFALFPWLTVQENVELGLEAQGVAVLNKLVGLDTRISNEVLRLHTAGKLRVPIRHSRSGRRTERE